METNNNKKKKRIRLDKNIVIALALTVLLSFSFYMGMITERNTTKEKEENKIIKREDNNTEEKAIEEKPNYKYVLNSSFLIGPDKKIVENTEEVNNKKVVSWYQDARCPSCVKFKELMRTDTDNIDNILNSGLYIRYYPLAFMNTKSLDNYSLRAASYILSSVEKATNVAYKFMDSIFSIEFLTKAQDGVTDDQIKELFIQAGGTEEQWKEILADYPMMSKEVMMKTTQVLNSQDILDKTTDGKISIPMILVGNSKKFIDFNTCGDSSVDCIMNSVKEYNKTITSEKQPISFEGLLDSYRIGDTMSISIKTENEFNKVVWKIRHEDETEDLIHNDRPTLEYVLTSKDKGSYIIAETLDAQNKTIEKIESKINIKEE